jgi:hypothetical protein
MHKQHVLILNVLLVHVRIKSNFFFFLKNFFMKFLVPGQPNTGGGGTGMMNMYLTLKRTPGVHTDPSHFNFDILFI